MNLADLKVNLKVALLRILDKLPTRAHKIVVKTIIEARYVLFKMKSMIGNQKNTVDPSRIYYISPDRITKCLLQEHREKYFESERMRGKVVGGDWDLTNCEFATHYDVYDAFKKRINEGVEWKDTDYYKRILRKAESGIYLHEVRNEADLIRRCEYLDSLYEKIKNEGYRLNRENYQKSGRANLAFGEIDVNIGRNGEYIFRDGIHRLAIAKVIGVKSVPVMVFVRHKKWQEFREFVAAYAEQSAETGGKLYQPIVHPDLEDMPYDTSTHDYYELATVIEHNLGKKYGRMLDIGANLGFFCHKFEDLGYNCYAVERDPAAFQIMDKIKVAENKKFETFNKSIFEVDFVKNTEFDVVLALNIFHHFVKTKALFTQFVDLLKDLKTDELFFEPHLQNEQQMKGAYVNFNEREFVDFLMRHLSLNKSEIIYHDKNGRNVFKLSR
jgi:SAM-dependent methyltransferase